LEFNKVFQSALEEVLSDKVESKMKDYPSALRPRDIEEIMGCSENASYPALRAGDIPGAKKISNLGWRIPRETFFTWWFGKEMEEKKEFKPFRRVK